MIKSVFINYIYSTVMLIKTGREHSNAKLIYGVTMRLLNVLILVGAASILTHIPAQAMPKVTHVCKDSKPGGQRVLQIWNGSWGGYYSEDGITGARVDATIIGPEFMVFDQSSSGKRILVNLASLRGVVRETVERDFGSVDLVCEID